MAQVSAVVGDSGVGVHTDLLALQHVESSQTRD